MRQRVPRKNASLERLIEQVRFRLDTDSYVGGKPGRLKAPAGPEFEADGPHEVWGAIARQAGRTDTADKFRCAIDNLLASYPPEVAAEVRARLEPPPDVIPIAAAGNDADSDSAISRVSELSNADRFLAKHGKDIRYVVDTGEFLIWDGKRWVRDSDRCTRVRAMMAQVSRWIDAEVAREQDKYAREMLREWAERSERKAVINASVDLLATRKRIWVNAADLDSKHDLLNCQNGTVDLRTGKLRAHDRNDLLTCITPGDYQPGATHPLWTDTVTKFIPDDTVRDYLQRFIGYAATGFASEKAFPICWGGGNNGKGSIFETIAKRGLGQDYAVSISPDAVVNNGKHGQHQQERANIKFHGKRMALFEETADGDTLDAGAVKRMASGGDTMEARRLRMESFNFNPTHSVLLMTNAEPRVNCFDLAMKTRIKFVHFGIQVEPNAKIRQQLEADADVQSAVLAWIVEGAVRYFAEGLASEPQAVREATERYFRDQDTFGQFLTECFEVAEPGNTRYGEAKKRIFERYLSWAEDQGLKYRLSKISLGRELEKRGFANVGNDDRAEYDGLKLRDEF